MKYGIGEDAETKEFLLMDNDKHIIFARGSDRKLLEEFCTYENGHLDSLDKIKELEEKIILDDQRFNELMVKANEAVTAKTELEMKVEEIGFNLKHALCPYKAPEAKVEFIQTAYELTQNHQRSNRDER